MLARLEPSGPCTNEAKIEIKVFHFAFFFSKYNAVNVHHVVQLYQIEDYDFCFFCISNAKYSYLYMLDNAVKMTECNLAKKIERKSSLNCHKIRMNSVKYP